MTIYVVVVGDLVSSSGVEVQGYLVEQPMCYNNSQDHRESNVCFSSKSAHQP
jgi:hypothetical protein